MSTPEPRRLRRDAQQNLDRLLVVAAELFSARGLGVTLEEVASSAGVGVGTIYRRFSDKDALIEKVFEQKLLASSRLANECLEMPVAWEGLCTFLRQNLGQLSGDRGLQEFLVDAEIAKKQRSAMNESLNPLLAELISGAQAEGKLRDDFSVNDIPMIILMLAYMAHTHTALGPGFAGRYLELILKGLAPSPDPNPIPQPADEPDYARWIAGLTA